MPCILNRGFALVALVGFSAAAAEPALSPNPPSAAGGGPAIQFAEPFYDFGRVQSGRILTHDYIFTNLSDRVFEISDVKSSCGCTAVTNWNRRVEPGKTGVLPILFNSTGMAGPVTKNLWVISKDPDQPAVLLEFSATIWKLIDAIPAIATFAFGPDFQTNETRVIRLVSNLEEPVTLSPPVCSNRSFAAELKTVKPGKEFELLVSVVPPLGPGSLVVPITLKSSSPQMPVVSVTAYALVQPALTVMPPRIRLSLPLAEERRVVVTIRNNGSRPVTLSDPAINAEGAGVQLRELQPGKLFELVVSFPSGFRGRPAQPIEVRVKSDHPQSPVVTVPVTQLQPAEG